jgi:hypothetical protein
MTLEGYGTQDCGIPVVHWCNVITWANLLNSVLNLNVLWLGAYGNRAVVGFLVFQYLTAFLFQMSWIFYGFKLYVSPEDKCEFGFPKAFMFCYLLFGGLVVLGCLILLCLVPCCIQAYRQNRQNQENRED